MYLKNIKKNKNRVASEYLIKDKVLFICIYKLLKKKNQ